MSLLCMIVTASAEERYKSLFVALLTSTKHEIGSSGYVPWFVAKFSGINLLSAWMVQATIFHLSRSSRGSIPQSQMTVQHIDLDHHETAAEFLDRTDVSTWRSRFFMCLERTSLCRGTASHNCLKRSCGGALLHLHHNIAHSKEYSHQTKAPDQ